MDQKLIFELSNNELLFTWEINLMFPAGKETANNQIHTETTISVGINSYA